MTATLATITKEALPVIVQTILARRQWLTLRYEGDTPVKSQPTHAQLSAQPERLSVNHCPPPAAFKFILLNIYVLPKQRAHRTLKNVADLGLAVDLQIDIHVGDPQAAMALADSIQALNPVHGLNKYIKIFGENDQFQLMTFVTMN